MDIKINENGFKQAEALLNDVLFSLSFDKTNLNDLKKFKLLKAREQNLEFEMELAEMICGDNNHPFPYRSSHFLTQFFSNLGYNQVHDGSTRRFWVRDVLLESSIEKILHIIEKGLFNKQDFKRDAKDKGNNFEEQYQLAPIKFKKFIEDSLNLESTFDLSYLLDLNFDVELLFDSNNQTNDDELNKLIAEAKSRFLTPKDKHIALEKIWDAFERIKTYFEGNKKESAEKLVKLISEKFDNEFLQSEFTILTNIGNSYRIRHHETDKKELVDNKHINYLFFRMLTLINLCLVAIKETEEVKSPLI